MASGDEDVKIAFVGKPYGYDNAAVDEDEIFSDEGETSYQHPDGWIDINSHMDNTNVMVYGSTSSRQKYKSALQHLKPFRYKKGKKEDFPLKHAGFFSYITYHWLNAILWKVYKTGSASLIGSMKCLDENSAKVNGARFLRQWDVEIKRYGIKNASLGYILWRFIRTRLVISSIFSAVAMLFALITPCMLLRWLLDHAQSPERSLSRGLGLVGGIALTELLRSLTIAATWMINYETGIRARSAILVMIYHKVLKMRSLGDISEPQLMAMVTHDSQRVFEMVAVADKLVIAPMATAIVTAYCVMYLGWAALVGTAVFLVALLIQVYLTRVTCNLRLHNMQMAASRLTLVEEMINLVKVIKMYAWEKPFAKRVTALRRMERLMLQKTSLVQSLSTAFVPVVPLLAAVATFSTHVLTHHELTITQAFVVLAAYYALRPYGLSVMPTGLMGMRQLQGALSRIKELLSLPDFSPVLHQIINPRHALELRGAVFAWDQSAPTSLTNENARPQSTNERAGTGLRHSDTRETCGSEEERRCLDEENPGLTEVLHDITFEVPRGSLVAVVGKHGSGKSSLLAAVLGQLVKVDGEMAVGGGVAYVPTDTFLLQDTVKQNILFGNTLDPVRYEEVLQQCSLYVDFQSLPSGDLTEVGEQTVFSEPQARRVSLARALYSDQQIYLLDDPLEGADLRTAGHLFKHVIRGALAEKTVLLVTGQLHFMPQCDHILYMQDGRVVAQGTHAHLMENSGEYSDLYNTHCANLEQGRSSAEEAGACELTEVDAAELTSVINTRALTPEAADTPDDQRADERGRLVHGAEAGPGRPRWVWRAYLRAGGGFCVTVLALTAFVVPVVCAAFTNYWLAFWVDLQYHNHTLLHGNDTYVIVARPRHYFAVYLMSAVAVVTALLGRTFICMKASVQASCTLHDCMFSKVLRAPMTFFNTHSTRSILRRFSRDLNEVEVMLPMRLEVLVQDQCIVYLCLIVVWAVFPWLVIATLPLIIIFFLFRHFFKVTLLEVKQTEHALRAPLLSQLTNTVQGLHTIHAYHKEDQFLDRFRGLVDGHSVPYLLSYSASRWLELRLELLGICVLTATAMITALFTDHRSAAYAGLALVYAAQVASPGLLLYVARLAAEVEGSFYSVRRILGYIEDSEAEDGGLCTSRPPRDWPGEGALALSHVSLRYGPGLPLVLHDVTVNIQARERVSIVGRVGSGKSSLGVALWRLVELQGGAVELDGLDVSGVALDLLRSRLAYVPQEPDLFQGTIRFNLDPTHEYTDDKIWEALHRCHLKERVLGMDLRLETQQQRMVFTAVERQLIYLARALLRKNKVLFLDEAAADSDPDGAVHTVVREVFGDVTVLTVTHRLQTAMGADRVLVLQQGRVVEFDTPERLSANPQSHFNSLLSGSELQNRPFNRLL